MTKQKSTKRALLMSALSLLMCVSMLIGSTFAWFTDSVISGNNTIAAGNLDVELEYYNGTEWKTVNGATNLFDETLWEPGRTDVVYLRLKNIGSLALKYELAINIVSETPGINMAGEEFLLSDYIYMGVAEGQEPSFANRSAAQSAVASNAGIISEGYAADGEMVKGANDLYMAVVVYMPSSVTNEANYRGDAVPSIDLGINLIATQLMNEEDSFGKDYDEAAKYIISSDEEMIFNGTEFDTTVINNGTVDMINATIDTDKVGIQNHGNATLENVEVKAGSSADYAGISYAGSVTVYNNVNFDAAAGGIGIRDGAKVVFNSGKVNVGNANTSGRYCFYLAGAGSELTINGGNFSFSNNANKRAYIYADAGTTVYVNGGTFGKPSTRSDYKAGIMGSGTVIITGGTFGFDPSNWVADGYVAIKNGTNWYVVPEDVDFIVVNTTQLQNAINTATNGQTIALVSGVVYEEVTLNPGLAENLTIVGAGDAVVKGIHGVKAAPQLSVVGLTLKNINFQDKGLYFDVTGTPWNYVKDLTMTECTFVGSGVNDDVIGNRLFDVSSDSVGSNQYINIVIKDCTISNAIQGIRLGGLAGDSVISGNTITNVGHNAITLRSVNGNVLVEENTIDNGADRAFRIGTNSGSVTYKNNVITNCGDPDDGSNFKANTAGALAFEGNTVDGANWNPLA